MLNEASLPSFHSHCRAIRPHLGVTIDVLALRLPPASPLGKNKKKPIKRSAKLSKPERDAGDTEEDSEEAGDAERHGGDADDEGDPETAVARETADVFIRLIEPLAGYFWSDNATDALSFSAQLAVLLGNASQRTRVQTLDAQFGKSHNR